MKKNIASVLMMLYLVLSCSFSCFALEEFITVPISEEKEKSLWQAMCVASVPAPEDLQSGPDLIVSFDVAENGDILLGLENNQILLLDKDLNSINSFTFSTYGDFYVRWEEDAFLLYNVRSSVISKISKEGKLIQLIKTDDKSYENNTLWRMADEDADIKVGMDNYSVKNSFGPLNLLLPNYEKLVKTDAQGNETVLYRSCPMANVKQLLFAGVFIVLPVLFVCAILFQVSGSKGKKLNHMAKIFLLVFEILSAVVLAVVSIIGILQMAFHPLFLEEFFRKFITNWNFQYLWIPFSISTFILITSAFLLNFYFKEKK